MEWRDEKKMWGSGNSGNLNPPAQSVRHWTKITMHDIQTAKQ